MVTYCCFSCHGYLLAKLQAVVVAVVLVSEENKLEVGTTSIILSYLYCFGNGNNKLFRYY